MTTPTEPAFDWTQMVEEPDISHIEIEDDEPVHGLYSEKQQRLLTETLYSSWDGPRTPEGGRAPIRHDEQRRRVRLTDRAALRARCAR